MNHFSNDHFSNDTLFKKDLQKLADEIGIEIRIAHYPPYTSKYNPIEHQGVVFRSIEIVNDLINKITTSKGLKVFYLSRTKYLKLDENIQKGSKKTCRLFSTTIWASGTYRAIPSTKK